MEVHAEQSNPKASKDKDGDGKRGSSRLDKFVAAHLERDGAKGAEEPSA